MAKLPFKFLLLLATIFGVAAIVSLIKGELLTAAACASASAWAVVWATTSHRSGKQKLG